MISLPVRHNRRIIDHGINQRILDPAAIDAVDLNALAVAGAKNHPIANGYVLAMELMAIVILEGHRALLDYEAHLALENVFLLVRIRPDDTARCLLGRNVKRDQDAAGKDMAHPGNVANRGHNALLRVIGHGYFVKLSGSGTNGGHTSISLHVG